MLAGVATDTLRGWRLTKRKSRAPTDALIALAMAVDRLDIYVEPTQPELLVAWGGQGPGYKRKLRPEQQEEVEDPRVVDAKRTAVLQYGRCAACATNQNLRAYGPNSIAPEAYTVYCTEHIPDA